MIWIRDSDGTIFLVGTGTLIMNGLPQKGRTKGKNKAEAAPKRVYYDHANGEKVAPPIPKSKGQQKHDTKK